MKALVLALLLVLGLGCATAPPPAIPVPTSTGQQAPHPTMDVDLGDTEGQRVATIRFNTGVSHSTVAVFQVLMASAALEKADHIVVVLDSNGGSLQAAMEMGQSIRASRIPVTCVVEHLAASGAFIALQSCPVRTIVEDARVLIHEAYVTWPAGSSSIWNDAARQLYHESLNKTVAEVQCKRLVFATPEDCHNRYRYGDWVLNSAEALKVGAVDKVVPSVFELVDDIRHP